MHRPVTSISRILASTLSVALLAGCPNAGTAPPLQGDAKFSPAPSGAPAATGSPAASATGSASPAAAGSASPAAGATTPPTGATPSAGTPATSNPAPSGAKTVLQGKVYDEDGATVDGATVTIRSLDTRQAYSATAQTDGGNYVVNDVPVGVQLEIAVARTGWTRRARVTSLQSEVSVRNVINFGAADSAVGDDLAGAAYFISDFPEITSATPGVSPATGDKLSYRIRFSEPLDTDNRNLVEDSVSIDTAAAPTDLVPDTVTGAELAARLLIEDNSTFLDAKRRVKFTWNAELTEVLVEFDAPLRALNDDEKAYRFRLIRRVADDPIEDAAGNVLGFTEPTEGDTYFAVKKASLTLETTPTSATTRWQDTHQRSTSFDVAEDDTDPVLKKVETSEEQRSDRSNQDFLRVDLFFSEPMRVYPDDKGYPQNVIDVENFIFAFADDAGDLDGVDLEDTPDDHDTATEAAAAIVLRSPIRFAATADADVDLTDDVFAEPSDDDPTVVSVFLPLDEIPDGLEEIKVLATTRVTDPAGNQVSEGNQDDTKKTADNVVIGLI